MFGVNTQNSTTCRSHQCSFKSSPLMSRNTHNLFERVMSNCDLLGKPPACSLFQPKTTHGTQIIAACETDKTTICIGCKKGKKKTKKHWSQFPHGTFCNLWRTKSVHTEKWAAMQSCTCVLPHLKKKKKGQKRLISLHTLNAFTHLASATLLAYIHMCHVALCAFGSSVT